MISLDYEDHPELGTLQLTELSYRVLQEMTSVNLDNIPYNDAGIAYVKRLMYEWCDRNAYLVKELEFGRVGERGQIYLKLFEIHDFNV